MISQIESFLYSDKQGTPEKGQRIQRPKHCVSIYHNKDEDNIPKNHDQNNSFYGFEQGKLALSKIYKKNTTFLCLMAYQPLWAI